MLFGSTKGQTLKLLSKDCSKYKIPDLRIIRWEDWCTDRLFLLKKARVEFAGYRVAIRSSCIGEDGQYVSAAGEFLSVLDVDLDNEDQASEIIDKVFASYLPTRPHQLADDEVIVQKMVQGVSFSGVIFTKNLDDGAPYYTCSYDDVSGKTDQITSGKGEHTTVHLYRNSVGRYPISGRLGKMMELAQFLEKSYRNIPLDIEFAVDKEGQIFILQVRPISTAHTWHPVPDANIESILKGVEELFSNRNSKLPNLVGSRTLLGNMPDWNPAELLGAYPRPLALSLFQRLISDSSWSKARGDMGYKNVRGVSLVISMAGRPYVDIRASFNSFLPSNLDEKTGGLLIDYWLNKLELKPSSHDKVEFEVACPSVHFGIEKVFKEYSNCIETEQLEDWKQKLTRLTGNAIDLSDNGTLSKANSKIETLSLLELENPKDFDSTASILNSIGYLIDETIALGTIPFSQLARTAFIAESLLRSMISERIITEKRISEFKSSIQSVTYEYTVDTALLADGTMSLDNFLLKYGHLRPSSFDIESLCYAQRPSLFSSSMREAKPKPITEFNPTGPEKLKLDNNIRRTFSEFEFDTEYIFAFCKQAIEARERGKFVFTRVLNCILEHIAEIGSREGLSRYELSYVTIDELLNTNKVASIDSFSESIRRMTNHSRSQYSCFDQVKLGFLIREVSDIYIVPLQKAVPTFITKKKIETDIVHLRANASGVENLSGKIVCIENADPGYDWIFARGIAGLITQYGGANSHMAIRCSEHGLPAAIGCGELMFTEAISYRRVLLDCEAQKLIGF